MLKILVLFMFCFCLCLFASTNLRAGESDSARVTYYGGRSAPNFEMALNTETYRTEYRTIQVPYTERVCAPERRYRQECRTIPGERVCRTETRTTCQDRRICRPGPQGQPICTIQRVCQNVPVQVCQTLPPRTVCQNVPYDEMVCRDVTRYRTETRPVQVLDKRVNAHINYTVANHANLTSMDVEFQGDLRADQITLRAQDNGAPSAIPACVALARVNGQRQMNGDTLFITGQVDVALYLASQYRAIIEREAVLAPQNLGLVRIDFPYAVVPDLNEIGFYLRLNTVRGMAIDRPLNPSEYRLVKTQESAYLEISLAQLLGPYYGPLRGSSMTMELGVTLRPAGVVLNAHQFSNWAKGNFFNFILY
ncbi:MAG: hypothetical protein A2X86_13395 [Bdellovibrionales bacterium GWA2_49_15]|nr:MAG: hypothetical protein A2X86_13395 [Bdellovibrionales bacterium GWA2_49_15]HAZ13520.1 hypothetical protein [Bdellovibrionales bacterium]